MSLPRLSRRGFFGATLAAACSVVTRAAGESTPGVVVADLKDQLEKGLRARLPREFAFIAQVVDMVEHGRLPLELVVGTFHWAREKATYKRYPFPYFEQALRIRARRQGITI
jgi:hypothetical protein